MLTFVEAGKLSLDRLAKALVESAPELTSRSGAESVVLIVEADQDRVKRIFQDHGLECGAVALRPDLRAQVSEAIASPAPSALSAEAVSNRPADFGEVALFDGLNRRDREVVSLVVDGLSNKEIGTRLGIAETSVKRALQRVFNQCGVRTRGQVVRLAMEDRFRSRAGSQMEQVAVS